MKNKAFTYFVEEVAAANAAAPVWRFSEYWDDLTPNQARRIQEILALKPEIRRAMRDGRLVLILPTGREWEVIE